MITSAIFDVDGVIIKRELYFSERLMRDRGIAAEKVMPFFKEVFPLCVVGKADLKEELLKCLPAWDWSGSVDEFLAYWFGSETDVNIALLEHVKDLRTRGIRCYLYTNNERYRTEYIWNTLNLKNSFDGIFSSGETGYRKSEQEFWETVYERLGRPKKRDIVVWDDNADDLQAVKDLGFRGERYTDFNSYAQRMAWLMIWAA